jgi:hypothetical protein
VEARRRCDWTERSFFEARFGESFGDVRVHTGSDAAGMNAQLGSRAFTHRQDVYFGGGEYRSGSKDTRHLPTEAPRALADPGPFGGMVAGYLNWTHSVDERVGQAQLAPVILTVCRSNVARTDNARYQHAIREIAFPLSNLVGSHGFADGDALISRDDDYLRYVQREAQNAVAAAGLSGDVGRFDTHHNPIRLVGDLRLHGPVVAKATALTAASCGIVRSSRPPGSS